ncbi:sialate O-acetylesterase [Zhouia sp. PK063]|uniref:sialate O-acetylesterase n=1 Tax=Zhouia sp. PK063 TaxID=3373602 RepID=UPI0037B150D6
MKNYKLLLLLSCTLGSIHLVSAKISLPSIFTDNMVLQQKAKVPIWGETEPNKSITVTASWDHKNYKTTADATGKWGVTLKTPSYGGPFSITIKGNETKTLHNILIGEVWLCSGQSNMEFPVNGWTHVNNYQEEIKNANYDEIRLLQAEHVYSSTPEDNLKVQHGGWQVCSPSTISDFSAVAYFFARKIWQEKHIPIGLIHSSWGGTVIEAWTSSGALKTIHDFDDNLKAFESENGEKDLQKQYEEKVAKWNELLAEKDKGTQNGKALWATSDLNTKDWKTMILPSFFEKSGLTNFDGIVWFRKKINLSKEQIQHELTVSYYVDDNDKFWVNGHFIGETQGYTTESRYKIPKEYLHVGENVLTIRVYDGAGQGGVYGNSDQLKGQLADSTFSLAGDWKYKVGVSLKEMPLAPYLAQGQNQPTVLFNAMIHPLLKLPIAGVIWYQGENNADRAEQYQTLFPLLIEDWRAKFHQKKLPFYFVQLANFLQAEEKPGPSAWAELREAQFKTLKEPYTGMAVAIDIGNPNDVHPKNKQEVGDRLARIALANTYDKEISYSGPLYTSCKIKGNAMILSFKYHEGMYAKGSADLKGFAIAGPDKIFHWATAKIEGNTIRVYSSAVPHPVSVRYDWANNPNGNLYNSAHLPASPFRTDDWPGITAGRK